MVKVARDWWHSLTGDQRGMVRAWLRDHPPPSEWRGTPIDWAYTEGPDVTTALGRIAWAVDYTLRMGRGAPK